MSQINIEQVSPIKRFKTSFESARKAEKDKPNLMVEHYIVTWTIENFNLLVPVKLIHVTSPTFSFDLSNTEWNIEMYSKSLTENQGATGFLLHRTDKNGPPKVGLTLKFGVSKVEGPIKWLKAESKVRDLASGNHSEGFFNTAERNTFVRNIADYEEQLTITCETYVTFEIPHYDDRLLSPDDYDLINFSFDFSKLINSLESADYRVMTSKNSIRVHKAILAARSQVFQEILRRPECRMSVKFDDVAFENLYAILNFMYSGSYSKMLSYLPSIGLYECAQKFALLDLITYLWPREIKVRSSLKNQSIKFVWNIDNFSLRVNNSPADSVVIKSPQFSSAAPNSPKWVLLLTVQKAKDQLALYAEANDETKSLHSVLKLSLLDRDNEQVNTRITDKFSLPKRMMDFPNFLSNFSVHNRHLGLVIGDNLRICCEILFTVSCDVVEAHVFCALSHLHILESYRQLSCHMNILMANSELSDVALRSFDNQIYPVHKSVLFARSSYFRSRFLYYNRNDTVLLVPDLLNHIIVTLIQHAYTGVLKALSVRELIIMCYAAEKYVFRQLILIILHRLASQINVENFFQLYRESNIFVNKYLKAKCEAYARENARTIIEAANWQEWRQQDNELCTILINFLRTLPSTT